MTRIAFDSHKNKLLMAAGTEGGKVALFDLRMKRPLSVVEHKNETAVLDVDFHESGKIVSADSKAIKIWDIVPFLG